MSSYSIASYAQNDPIIGLTVEQKRQLAKYKVGFQYQKLDLINYQEQLKNSRQINKSLIELERLTNSRITELKEVIKLKDVQLQTYKDRLQIKMKPRANWWLIAFSFIVGFAGGYYITM